MTEREANKLVLMLVYNFAAFLPPDPQGAALKKGMWMSELLKYEYQQAEDAVAKMIHTMHYPPQIADLREAMLPAVQKGLPGPVFGTKEGFDAMYTADMDHVDKLMAKLMEEL